MDNEILLEAAGILKEASNKLLNHIRTENSTNSLKEAGFINESSELEAFLGDNPQVNAEALELATRVIAGKSASMGSNIEYQNGNANGGYYKIDAYNLGKI